MNFKKDIVKLLKDIVKIDESIIEIPPRPEMGDYSLPCFSLAKEFKKSPAEIAQELARKLPLKQPISRIEIKGPYLNFFISKDRIAESVLNDIAKEKERFGSSKGKSGKEGSKDKRKRETVMIEFPSPNTNKSLHLGHVRNIVIGDRGIHICKSMLAYQKFGKDSKGKPRDPCKEKIKTDHFVGDFYVKFNDAAKENPDLEEEAKDMLLKWEKKDKEVRKLWKIMNTWAYEGFEETYEKLGVSFNKYYYESDFYDKGKDIIIKALKKGIFRKDESGAVIAGLDRYKTPDKVLLRADGTSIYITQDIFLARKKFTDYKLDRSIYVVASEQNTHFMQLFSILDMLGYRWAKKCFHLSYGMVYLPNGRMKSREGTVVDADDLIEEMKRIAEAEIMKRDKKLTKAELKKRAEIVGLGALKFYFAKMDAAKDMVYNPEESISFEGETGPYVQYTYARICSILKKYGKKPDTKIDFKLLKESKENELIKMLGQFPDEVAAAAEHLRPHLIATYLIRLCQAFNSIYHEFPILQADEETKKARILMISCVKQVIANSLDLLGIEYVERM
ncbi:MAG: arginine--tRNA ligase [Candidatus Woesearchaeota archaeon]|nr:arginine--tRNA ligase [Candidatus Woesearchaeota archaeon]